MVSLGASESGHIDAALLLLEWGTNANAWCNGGTVLQVVSEGGHLDTSGCFSNGMMMLTPHWVYRIAEQRCRRLQDGTIWR
jgi:hypothetical protein